MLGFNTYELNIKTTGSSETSASNYKTTRFKNQENHKMGITYVGSLKCSFTKRTFLVTDSPLSLSLLSVQLHVLPLPTFAAVGVRFGARIGSPIDFPPNTSGFSFQYLPTIFSIHTFNHPPSTIYSLCY
jgi:hypothetical protein